MTILYINGEKAQDKIGVNQVNTGFNQIVVRMEAEVSKGKAFSSSPYMIDFEVTGDKITIKHPVARSLQEAKRAFKGDEPAWAISQDGKSLSYQQRPVQRRDGFMPYAKMGELIAEQNKQRGIYFENGKLMDKPVEAISAVTSQKTGSAKQPTSRNLDQLKAWYLKSSKQERKDFRRWMIDQE